jgi:hypothetical protein
MNFTNQHKKKIIKTINMDKFYELSEETISKFYEILNLKTLPINIKFEFIGNSKQKEMIKISKISDQYSFIMKKEIMISINEEMIENFDDDSISILMEQEIDKLYINIETGKIKLLKTDLNTFSSLVNKHGIEKVARANKVEELYIDQKDDQKTCDNFLN